ncbi:MAG: hypothetical protein K5669_12340 [Lachnospiraceae bacterium]|nr:hypothetical protein [Lachnospiraceae bacterium]
MADEVKLIYLSDLHLITINDEIRDEEIDNINGRIGWSSYEGVSAKEQWSGWVDTLNKSGADYLLFGADMVDFPSQSNIAALKSEMDKLTIPYMYIRADHDLTSTYLKPELTYDITAGYQESICPVEDVYVKEFDDFIVVGWNNSTSLLSVSGMERIDEAVQIGKPLILLTHVPIAPIDDDSLAELSRSIYQDRALIWGNYQGYGYFPNGTAEGDATAKLLDLLYADDSPFVEVLCGHLHASWDGYISPGVHEHVFDAAFNRHYGIITVSGD